MKRLLMTIVSAIAIVAMSSACSLRATDMPLPGTAMSGDHYRVFIVLKTALNLPDKAKVFLEGVEVGKIDSVVIEGRDAVAVADIRTDVELSKDTRAQVKQASLMGDLFVELSGSTRSPNSEVMRDGDRIPLSHTEPPDNIEDMLRSLSVFVVGAPVQDVADLVNQINSAMPNRSEVASLSASAKRNLHDLAASGQEISTILESAESISTVLRDNSDRVDMLLDQGPPRIGGLKDILYGVIDLMMSLAHFTAPLTPVLVPITPDLKRIIAILKPAALAVASSDRTLASNAADVNSLMRSKLIPFLSSPLNIAIRGGQPASGSAGQRADSIVRILRGIGMIR
ncbi:MlaD family protein [Gordonia malaquae]|uniref:MlaD family protein n=1 Tax=Gordonia malaquae TaxID=410332 RepID=UPI0030C78C47